MLDNPLIELTGEIGDGEKGALLGDVIALLSPVDWPKPFGLVQIEAMATGVSVIAFRRGTVPKSAGNGTPERGRHTAAATGDD